MELSTLNCMLSTQGITEEDECKIEMFIASVVLSDKAKAEQVIKELLKTMSKYIEEDDGERSNNKASVVMNKLEFSCKLAIENKHYEAHYYLGEAYRIYYDNNRAIDQFKLGAEWKDRNKKWQDCVISLYKIHKSDPERWNARNTLLEYASDDTNYINYELAQIAKEDGSEGSEIAKEYYDTIIKNIENNKYKFSDNAFASKVFLEMGEIYLTCEGYDYATALEYFDKSIDKKSIINLYKGIIYYSGDYSLSRDIEQSLFYFSLVSKSDSFHIVSAYYLFMIQRYHTDKLVNRKDVFALIQYYEIDISRTPEITFELAKCYIDGYGVKINKVHGISLLKEASTSGSSDASLMLSEIFEEGKYVPRNLTQAKYYVDIAYSQGSKEAESSKVHHLMDRFLENLEQDEAEILSELWWYLQRTVISIKNEHLYQGVEMISHFTSLSTIESILPNNPESGPKNVLRLYNVNYMNDPTEGKSLVKLKTISDDSNLMKTVHIIDEIIEMQESKSPSLYVNELSVAPYSVSFTRSSDRLDLWRAYGNNGDGICLTFIPPNKQKSKVELDFLDSARKQRGTIQCSELNIYEIKYQDNDKKDTINKLSEPLIKVYDFIEGIENSSDRDSAKELVYLLLCELLFLYKDEQYLTENELRIVKPLNLDEVKMDSRIPGRLFAETEPFLFKDESMVVIGPRVNNKEEWLWDIRYRLKINKLSERVKVFVSEVNYR